MGKLELVETGLLAELRAWGGPVEMGAFEAVMWNADVEPRLRSAGTLMFMLDKAPNWDRFVAEHRWLVDAVPRFRQRVLVPAFGAGNPTWTDYPEFDLGYHVRRLRVAEPCNERQLLDAVAVLAMTPFDRSRAPWEVTLFEGLEDGRAAYVLKLHHAMSDGLGLMQLFSRVFTRDRAQTNRPHPPTHNPGHGATAVGLGAKALSRALIGWPAMASGAASVVLRRVAELATHPGSARASLSYLASAKRMLGIKPVKGSALFRRRSLAWRLDAIEIPLIKLKAASKAVDASVNDTFLSGLIGGFRRYHEQMGVAVRDMPIGFPISLRVEGDALGGNKFAGSQYAAPVTEKDPVERIRHIQRFVRDTRAEPAFDVMFRLMPAITRLPLTLVTKLTGEFTAAQDVQVSNVPGISHPVFFAGAEVTHLWPFGPVPGCGMMIAMVSHNGRCCIGINSDCAAVTEPELLIECLREGLDEVLALAKAESAPKPTLVRTNTRKKA